MEIFTSMTFWVIIVVIIVLLAIVGYVAEGTILAGKKQEKKEKEEKPNEEKPSAWTDSTLETDDKQETVYNTADQSWLEMPDVINAPASTLDTSKETPMVSESLTTPSTPATLEAKSVIPESSATQEASINETTSEVMTEPIPAKATSTISNNEQPSLDDAVKPVPDVTTNNKSVDVKEKNNKDKKENTESLDIWTD